MKEGSLSTFPELLIGRLLPVLCFVCLFFASSPLPHAPLSPPPHLKPLAQWNTSCTFFCATDPSQGEAAEAVDNRSLEEILGSIPPPPPPAMTNEPGAPRLMITHLVNRNFKSYAGEQILGPFHKVRPKLAFSRKPCKTNLVELESFV